MNIREVLEDISLWSEHHFALSRIESSMHQRTTETDKAN